jgi:hypothetical protein
MLATSLPRFDTLIAFANVMENGSYERKWSHKHVA